MANLSEKHKAKKSQKRKDRQERRTERQKAKKEKQFKEIIAVASSVESSNISEEKPKKTKSLPGFLAKHCDEICLWLHEYLVLRMKSDDAGIDWLKDMSAESRKTWIDEHIQIHEFLDVIASLRNSKQQKNDVVSPE